MAKKVSQKKDLNQVAHATVAALVAKADPPKPAVKKAAKKKK
jgi:hypothetical protein